MSDVLQQEGLRRERHHEGVRGIEERFWVDGEPTCTFCLVTAEANGNLFKTPSRPAIVDRFRDAICPCSNWPLMQIEGGLGLGDVLPFTSLRHIKELELDSFYEESYVHPSWQQWPMAWSRLTALTSLTCTLKHYGTPHVPAVLNRMTSLRSLKIWQFLSDSIVYPEYEDFDEAAEQMALENTTNLIRLTCLEIDGYTFINGSGSKTSTTL